MQNVPDGDEASRSSQVPHNVQATQHDENPVTESYPGQDYNKKRREYYIGVLREKWACEIPGHVICVPSEDGQHFTLSDKHVEDWVDAIFAQGSTTAEPPHGVFESVRGGAVFNRTTGELRVQAVSIPPSRTRYEPRRTFDASSARSINSTITATTAGATITGSRMTRTAISISSAVPNSGHVGGKVITWARNKLNNVKWVRRGNNYIELLRVWETGKRSTISLEERKEAFRMLQDALEWSRNCYADKVNLMGYSVGRQVQQWLQSYHEFLQKPENREWIIDVQICLLPILLTRISHDDPLIGDLAFKTLHTLTKIPFAFHGSDTVADVVRLVAGELAYSKDTDRHHSWLGIWLLRVMDMSLKVRDLTIEELSAIQDLAKRREACNTNEMQAGERERRPWEVSLFALCASQDPRLKVVALGPNGLFSLVDALDRMLSDDRHKVPWDDVALTLRALAFLSEQSWVVEEVTPRVIQSLLHVFRCDLPEKWFCIRFWAADTIRNMVALRQELVRLLMGEGADLLVEGLSSPKRVRKPVLSINITSSAPSSVRSSRRISQDTTYTHTTWPSSTTSTLFSSPTSGQMHHLAPLLSPAHSGESQGVDSTSTGHGASSILESPLSQSSRGSGSSGGYGPPVVDAGQSALERSPSPPNSSGRRFSFRTQTSSLENDSRSERNNTAVPSHGHQIERRRAKVSDEYMREASKRASELATFVQQWNKWTPDKLPQLEVVSGLGWTSQFEDTGWMMNEGEEA